MENNIFGENPRKVSIVSLHAKYTADPVTRYAVHGLTLSKFNVQFGVLAIYCKSFPNTEQV